MGEPDEQTAERGGPPSDRKGGQAGDAQEPGEKPAKEDGEKDRGGKKRKGPPKALLIIGAILLVLVAVFGYRHWQYASKHEGTDDAYVTGHVHQISPRVSGTVREVLVDDNWHVTAGQPLVRLDRRDYEVGLQRAEAQLSQAKAQAAQAQAGISQAAAEVLQRKAQVIQAEAQLTQADAQFQIAKINYDRNSSLFQKDLRAVSKQDVDTTRASFDAARGAYEAAKATVEANKALVQSSQANEENARAQLATAGAAVGVSEAALADARLQLSYCDVIAPVAGYVARKSVEAGNRLQTGQQLMAVVEDNVWVLANLKETQLEKVQVGQPVEIAVDALPHHKFPGRVDSIQPGTGANFALLPPDNATGNFIKIVQRVPVKIVFDQDAIRDFRDKIVPGLSTQPSIDVSGRDALRPGPTPMTEAGEKTAVGVVQ